jgi:hypothetical protein
VRQADHLRPPGGASSLLVAPTVGAWGQCKGAYPIAGRPWKNEPISSLAADATGADAVPLLAFALSQLFKLNAPGHGLTLAHYNDIGGMGGCVARVLRQAQKDAQHGTNEYRGKGMAVARRGATVAGVSTEKSARRTTRSGRFLADSP